MASRGPRSRRRVRIGGDDLMDELMTGGTSHMSESNASGNDCVDDDETESEPDYGRHPSRHDAAVDSDSASDAAEDLEATSSDDDNDHDPDHVKVEAHDDTSSNTHGANHHRHHSSPNNVKHERVRLYKADDGDDDANDVAADDEDDSDDETEDDESDAEVYPASRAVSGADFERAARYEAEEQAIIQNEEQGVRDLFGDGDDEDDGVGHKDVVQRIETRPNDDTRTDADAPSMSFTDALLSANRDDQPATSTTEPAETQGETTAVPLFVNDFEMFEAKSVLWNILSNVSHRETVALRRGDRVDGPPTEDPIAHVDEFKRKFRWPVRVMNLPKNDFAQDPSEIYDDYELQLTPSDAKSAQPLQHRRTFAQVPRPIVEAAAAAMAAAQQQQQQQSTRKRKRPQSEAPATQTTSPATLNAVARASETFTDRFLESLICDNAAALQGAKHSHSQRSWTRLPVSRMPVANWRFVLEHAAATSERVRPSASVAPPLREATLARIRARLKTLNALPWQNDDDSVFGTTSAAPTATPEAAPAAAPTATPAGEAPAAPAESPSEAPVAAPSDTPELATPEPATPEPATPELAAPAPAPAPASAPTSAEPPATPAVDPEAPVSEAPTPDVVML